jgi:DNA-nicking Smr family endonuclease
VTKKTINSEDSHLFRKTIGTVRTITSDKVLLNEQSRPKPVPRHKVSPIDDYFQGFDDTNIEKLAIEDTLSFSANGLQKNVVKKLRQGYFGLDAEIDLHGLNSHDAKQQLIQFLHHGVQNGWRCVHIVHGKGYRSVDNHPVLKNNLNIWLRQHKQVLAFCSAAPKHGGAGAVVVLLQLTEKFDDSDNKNF